MSLSIGQRVRYKGKNFTVIRNSFMGWYDIAEGECLDQGRQWSWFGVEHSITADEMEVLNETK